MWTKKKKLIDKLFDDNSSNKNRELLSEIDDGLDKLKMTTKDVVEVAVKITQKLEKDEGQESHYRIYQIIDSMSDLVIIKDAVGRWKTLNVYGQKLFGMHHNEFYYKTNEELSQMFPQFEESFLHGKITDEQTWKWGISQRSIEKFVTKNKEVKYFDVIKNPVFNEHGLRKEIIVIGRDVTSSHKNDEIIQSCYLALNTSKTPTIILDSSLRFAFVNKKFVQEFGLEHYEEFIGKSFGDIFTNYNIKISNMVIEVIDKNEISCDWDTKYRKFTLFPVRSGDNVIQFYTGTFTN